MHQQISWFAEDGSHNFSRAEENNERGDDVAVNDLVESILEHGLNQEFAGGAVAKRHEPGAGGATRWRLLTFGHRAAAVYKAQELYPDNANVKLTVKMGLRNLQEVRH